MLSHPLSNERIRNIKINFEGQKLRKYKDLDYRFKLVKSKLNGFFLQGTNKFLYPNKQELESLYAYALNSYRIGKINNAILLIDKCIKIDSDNPYFHELKGQMYYETGLFKKQLKVF